MSSDPSGDRRERKRGPGRGSGPASGGGSGRGRAGEARRGGSRGKGGGRGSRPGNLSFVWLREEPRGRRAAFSREAIAAAGLALADAEGFEAVSMRRIARELGAGTMTLYHYVRSKDELVTLMHDAVMGEVLVPEGELPADWREALTVIAQRTRSAFERHRWLLDRVGGPHPGPNGMRHFEQSLQAVEALGLEDEERFELISVVDDYVFGFVIREGAEGAGDGQADRLDDFAEFVQRQLESGDYPRVRAFFGDDAEQGIARVRSLARTEGRFERGLTVLLDGIAARLAADR